MKYSILAAIGREWSCVDLMTEVFFSPFLTWQRNEVVCWNVVLPIVQKKFYTIDVMFEVSDVQIADALEK